MDPQPVDDGRQLIRARKQRPSQAVDFNHHLRFAQCTLGRVCRIPQIGFPGFLYGDEPQTSLHELAVEGALDLDLVAARQFKHDGPAGSVSDDHWRLRSVHAHLIQKQR